MTNYLNGFFSFQYVLGTHPNGKELLAIGYRYNSKKTLMFVATEDAGSTTKGTPYEMKFADGDGNVHVRYVDRPDVNF